MYVSLGSSGATKINKVPNTYTLTIPNMHDDRGMSKRRGTSWKVPNGQQQNNLSKKQKKTIIDYNPQYKYVSMG